jgi:mRNA interferase RelE/StbE
MSYKLVYTERAIKDIQRLDTKVKTRIGRTLIRYEQDPLRYAKKLSDPELGSYRFRIGDYRIIFDLIGEDIVILRVGHRSQIYKG